MAPGIIGASQELLTVSLKILLILCLIREACAQSQPIYMDTVYGGENKLGYGTDVCFHAGQGKQCHLED